MASFDNQDSDKLKDEADKAVQTYLDSDKLKDEADKAVQTYLDSDKLKDEADKAVQTYLLSKSGNEYADYTYKVVLRCRPEQKAKSGRQGMTHILDNYGVEVMTRRVSYHD